MKTREEIRDWILENCTKEDGDINLSYLDFEGRTIDLSHMKGHIIKNSFQTASFRIDNESQSSKHVYNEEQEADIIHNFKQKSKERINNYGQKSIYILNQDQEAKKIKS